jgi:hypothetical protein
MLLLMSSLLIFCFNKHDLPSFKCSDQECIADFQLQKDIRLNHPAAYSLEFQNVMQITMDCMLRWDSKKQTSKGKGILGTVWHFQQQMKNKAGKHFIVIGKYGSRILIKHSEIVCFMKT